MASLAGQNINATYFGLIKTCDSAALPSTGQELLSDGVGNESALSLGQKTNGISICGPTTIAGGDITHSTCTACLNNVCAGGTLGVTGVATLNGVTNICGNLNATGVNCLNGSNTIITNCAVVGSSSSQSNSVLTVTSTDESCSGLTVHSNGKSPYIKFIEEDSSKCFVAGIDNSDSDKFKISHGITPGNNSLVITTGGKVGINTSPTATSSEFNVCGNSKFSGNTCIINSSLILTDTSEIQLSNGTGDSSKFIGKNPTTGRLEWKAFGDIPGGGCTGNVSTGTTTSVNVLPKFEGTDRLTNSNVSDDGVTVGIAQQLNVSGNAFFNQPTAFYNTIKDFTNCGGSDGQVLTSTGTGISWRDCVTSASSLQNTLKFNVKGALTGTAQNFNGTQDVNIPVDKINASCLKSGTVSTARLPDINACKLQNHRLSSPGDRFNVITHVEDDGAMEIGRFLDFHRRDNCSSNCDASIQLFDNCRMHFTGRNVHQFQFDGNICATHDIIAFTSSDKNLKKDLSCVSDSNNIITSLNSYCFKFNEKSSRKDELSIGFIAQEVEEVLPRAVKKRDDGTLGIDYLQFIPILSEEIKRLNSKIEELESKINN